MILWLLGLICFVPQVGATLPYLPVAPLPVRQVPAPMHQYSTSFTPLTTRGPAAMTPAVGASTVGLSGPADMTQRVGPSAMEASFTQARPAAWSTPTGARFSQPPAENGGTLTGKKSVSFAKTPDFASPAQPAAPATAEPVVSVPEAPVALAPAASVAPASVTPASLGKSTAFSKSSTTTKPTKNYNNTQYSYIPTSSILPSQSTVTTSLTPISNSTQQKNTKFRTTVLQNQNTSNLSRINVSIMNAVGDRFAETGLDTSIIEPESQNPKAKEIITRINQELDKRMLDAEKAIQKKIDQLNLNRKKALTTLKQLIEEQKKRTKKDKTNNGLISNALKNNNKS